MAEIKDFKNLACVHLDGRILKMFDNSEESVLFAEKFEKEYNIKVSCDPLYNVINRIQINAEIKFDR